MGLTNGLVGYRTFDGNNANDKSGNGYTGTLTGNIYFTGGKLGRTAVFDGNGDYIRVADSASLDGFSSFTFSVRAYPRATSSYRRIMDKNYTNGYNFSISSDDTFYFYVDGQWASSSGVTVDENAWNHLVVTYDGVR